MAIATAFEAHFFSAGACSLVFGGLRDGAVKRCGAA